MTETKLKFDPVYLIKYTTIYNDDMRCDQMKIKVMNA